MKYIKCNKKKGFTLIELILVVAMVSAIAMFGSTVDSSFLWRTNMSVSQYSTVVGLRRTQVLAQSGMSDADWGMHIEGSQFTIFKGSNFDNRDASFDEEYDLNGVEAAAEVDVIYHKLSGKPFQSSEINLVAGGRTASIIVTSLGTINY